jgi:hypothetical protein
MHSQDEFETLQYCRWDMLNYLIKLYGYKSYLEIGAAAGYNFHKINCSHKVCVDPEKKFSELTHNCTSDDFFENNTETFDLIFIDGLHVSDQVIIDIENSLKILNPMGTIMMHDCLPISYEQQTKERTQWNWTGDVWKAFAHYRQRPDLTMFTCDTDFGLGFVKKGFQTPWKLPEDFDYDYYTQNVFPMMNMHTVFKSWQIFQQLKNDNL